VKIAVLGNEDSWYVEQLLRAASLGGHDGCRVDFRTLGSEVESNRLTVQGSEICLSDFDALVVRTMPPGSLEQVVYRMDVLLQLQQQGKTILNHPRAIECAVDKFLTTSRLANAGLPIPRTIVCETTEQALDAFQRLGCDVVVKPIFGAEGRGIIRLSDPDLAFRSFRTLDRLNSILYVQEFIHHEGYDIRVLILDGEVVGAIKRSSLDDFRTNVSRQGLATVHSVTDQERNLALSAARTVHASFAGVDLLYDLAGRCYILEVNAVPGWRAFQKATQIDVAQLVIESLERTE